METTLPAGKRRWIVLDVMKAVCICMVIITHMNGISVNIRKAILWPFTILPAVPTFLMMSVFVFAMAEDTKNGTVLSWFSWPTFWRRFNRFLFPQAVAIAVIIAGLFAFRDLKRISVESIFKMFQMGGRGPGAYYVMIMYQLLIVFPFVRMLFRKNQAATVIGMVLLHIAFEVLCKIWQINDELYNSLIFRFFIHMALGMLLYEYWDKLRHTALPAVCIIIGAIYLINVYYLGYQQVMIYASSTQGLIASLFSFGVLCYVMRAESLLEKYADGKRRHHALRLVCYIGKASYHIMLTQMVFFYFLRMFEIEARLGALWQVFLLDLGVSLSVGCLFYTLDQWMRRKLQSNIRKKALT